MTDASWIQSNKRPGWTALLFTALLFCAGGLPAGAQVPPLTDLAGDWQNAAEVRSLPALNSPLGSAQAVGDVLANRGVDLATLVAPSPAPAYR